MECCEESSPGSINNELFGVAAVSATNIWAVGFIANTTAAGSVQQTLIEHWNGTSWSVVSSPNPGSSPVLSGVAATSATNAWAVGNSGFNQTLVRAWNGTKWSVVEESQPWLRSRLYKCGGNFSQQCLGGRLHKQK